MTSFNADVPTCSYLFPPESKVGTSENRASTPMFLPFLPEPASNFSPDPMPSMSKVSRNSRNGRNIEDGGCLFCSTSAADVPTRKEHRAPGCIACGGSGIDLTRPLPWGGYESCARCVLQPGQPAAVHPGWKRMPKPEAA